MDRLHGLAEQAAEVDRRGRALQRMADAIGPGEVGLDEAELPDLGEGLDGVGLARIALGNANPDATVQQVFADVAADEPATAEHGHQLFRALDHRHGPSLAAAALTRRARRL